MSNRSKKLEKRRARNSDQEILMAYYRRNPDAFVEEYLGVKLFGYQRFVLRLFGKKWAKCQKNKKSPKLN